MNYGLIISIALACLSWGFAGYACLQTKYPGSGLQVIENIFKDTMPFEKAINALQQGSRIRRKSERKGYTKVIIIEGKNRTEKFGTYWLSDDKVSDYCSFSLEDVLSGDWIIDE
jgi:hypothetical protein